MNNAATLELAALAHRTAGFALLAQGDKGQHIVDSIDSSVQSLEVAARDEDKGAYLVARAELDRALGYGNTEGYNCHDFYIACVYRYQY
jgi:hypothetical protein